MSALGRTLTATLLVALALVTLLAIPHRGIAPLRQSTFELDEPNESLVDAPSGRSAR